MPSLNRIGPYIFTSEDIDAVITRTSPGNYALGYVNDNNTFFVQYVGRSDTNLN